MESAVLTTLLAVCTALGPQAPEVKTQFEQVAPVPLGGKPVRSEGQTRAVVLIHGFLIHFSSKSVPLPRFRDWQRPGSVLVRKLVKEADVFSVSYGQNVALDEIVRGSSLRDDLARLRKMGYREIVLIGHSAGGLIARHLVEDYPDAGVTKVVQVCTPNGGTPSAKALVPRNQKAFLDGLTEEGRQIVLKGRADRRIPASVEFVCVLAHAEDEDTDGLVPTVHQWTADLQKQCVPVVPVTVSHNRAVRAEASAETLARVVREKHPRWKLAQVEKAGKELFKK